MQAKLTHTLVITTTKESSNKTVGPQVRSPKAFLSYTRREALEVNYKGPTMLLSSQQNINIENRPEA